MTTVAHMQKCMTDSFEESLEAAKIWLRNGNAKEARREFKHAMNLLRSLETIQDVSEWWRFKHPDDEGLRVPSPSEERR